MNDIDSRDLSPKSDPPESPRVPPDFRQTLSHSTLAAAFILIGVANPFSKDSSDEKFFTWMFAVLIIVVALSWGFVIKRWLRWRQLDPVLRRSLVGQLRLDRTRTTRDGLMGALSLLLTCFTFLSRLGIEVPDGGETFDIPLVIGGVIGALAAAVLSSVARDVWNFRRR